MALVDHTVVGRASTAGTSKKEQTEENGLEKYFISNVPLSLSRCTFGVHSPNLMNSM